MFNYSLNKLFSTAKSSLNSLLVSRCMTSSNLEGACTILPVNIYTERTHNCGQLSKKDIGKNVTLFGWVQYTRFNNKIITLRDSYGITQCVLDDEKLKDSLKKVNIYNESVIKVSGNVRQRPDGQQNNNYPTGNIEIAANEIDIISLAKDNLPILSRDNNSTTLTTRLKYRYLDIRNSQMQHALRFRSHVCKILRNRLYDLNFVECETPTLFNRTPGGANEFIVPTKEPKKFYSLVQSPQQLKQLLMIGGLDRYFQICRCYRDEATRSDRQPEFTQLDIELSFTNQKLIIELINDLVYNLLIKISDDPSMTEELTKSFKLKDKQLKQITYKNALKKYGTDKPDTRFEWLIEEFDDDKLKFVIPHKINTANDRLSKLIDDIIITTNIDLPVNIDDTQNNYTIISCQDKSDNSRKLLGQIRLAIAKNLHEEREIDVYKETFSFIWVTEFPLFTVNDDGNLEPNHHPFTAPTNDSLHLLKLNPLDVIGQHYDLVLNGQEVAGGSIRIHDANLQKQIFTEILQLEEEDNFDYFIEALKSGCPPHGGIAFGLDRLVAILMNKTSIRDVIAFPKSNSGRDPLSNCPHDLSANVKRLYHII